MPYDGIDRSWENRACGHTRQSNRLMDEWDGLVIVRAGIKPERINETLAAAAGTGDNFAGLKRELWCRCRCCHCCLCWEIAKGGQTGTIEASKVKSRLVEW